MPKLTDAVSNIAIEKCKELITSVISEKFADKELQQKLQQLKVEKELESAMKSLSCSDNCSYVKPVEVLKCSEACSAKNQEIARLKESIDLLEQKLQCVRFFKKLFIKIFQITKLRNKIELSFKFYRFLLPLNYTIYRKHRRT